MQGSRAQVMGKALSGHMHPAEAWSRDVRIRMRPGRPDSGVKLYVTDHGPAGPRELMANTRFFRYPVLFDVLVDLLADMPARPLRVCIVPLSVGLEAVSFVIAGLRRGLFDRREVSVAGFDLSEKATDLALVGVYPRHFFPDDLEPLREYLDERSDGFVGVREHVARHIEVLPADDAMRPRHPLCCDLVLCLNLLMHVSEGERAGLVDSLAAMTAPGGLLVINNNQEWPQELEPHFRRLAAKGFVSLHRQVGSRIASNEGEPEFAITDARAMILRRDGN